MNSKRRFSWLALLSVIVWLVGSLMIFVPGTASENPDSTQWLLAGFVLQGVGYLLGWLHHRRAQRRAQLEAQTESRI